MEKSERAGVSVRELRDRCSAELGHALEAELMIAHGLGRNRAWLYAHLDDPVDEVDAIQALIERRRDGEPVAYILGRREFYGRDFVVTPDVLIPRPETELLIDLALELPLPDNARALDIGTGTGCIALTLSAERPGWTVMASDISSRALEVARRNRQRLGLDRVELFQADVYPSSDSLDLNLIVTNPPYINEKDHHLNEGDVRFEPRTALTPGADGLDVIRRIVDTAPRHLVTGGWLLIEHGHDQGAAVAGLLRGHGLTDVRTRPDLAGLDRVTMGALRSE